MPMLAINANEATAMGLYDAARLFKFEVESSENLRFIPLVVRYNLDRFGLRITLDQWQMLPYDDRVLLARFPVEADREIEPNFDRAVDEMLQTHANVEPEKFAPDADPVWAHADAVPETVIRQSSLAGVEFAEPVALGGTRSISTLCARETRAPHGRTESRFPARDARIRPC